MKSSVLRIAIVATAAVALAGCATDSYGRHGYVGASIGYGGPYYGWYDNYYYPGVGAYVYERSGARRRWNGAERRYWEARRPRTRVTENWGAYGGARPSSSWDHDQNRHHRH